MRNLAARHSPLLAPTCTTMIGGEEVHSPFWENSSRRPVVHASIGDRFPRGASAANSWMTYGFARRTVRRRSWKTRLWPIVNLPRQVCATIAVKAESRLFVRDEQQKPHALSPSDPAFLGTEANHAKTRVTRDLWEIMFWPDCLSLLYIYSTCSLSASLIGRTKLGGYTADRT